MTIPRPILFFLLTILSLGLVLSEKTQNSPAGENRVEKYQYEAVPMEKEEDTEEIEATFSFENDCIIVSSTKVSPKAQERTLLKLTQEGDLISGTRRRVAHSGSSSQTLLWRDEHRAYIERTSGEHKESTVIKMIPQGSTLAVEGSLVVLLRSFPYQSATTWHLFMIDFRGRSVGATARQTGIERITVPAGDFLCYQIEIYFGVPFLSKVACWLSIDKPHVLVKSVGKRGPLTPTYVTSLIRSQLP
jgi:hypothetical protein